MDRKILAAGAFFGMTAIILGAFGAHALKQLLSTEQLQVFETGVRYQMYNALFLLFIGTSQAISDSRKKLVFWLVSIGIIFFSGSIYFLALNGPSGLNKIVGPVTPVGGLLLIIGWFMTFVEFFRKKS